MSETATQVSRGNPLQYVSDQLGELRAKGTAPKLRVLEGEQKPVCVIDGREVINLASNNYLGLTTHKALRKAAIEAVRKYGAGAGAVVLGKEDLIISDELNHASIIDGARLSKATIKVFKHKDIADCERILQESANWNGHKLIITDGVFSMDGDIAPLPALCDLAEKYNCIMMVDDAHSSATGACISRWARSARPSAPWADTSAGRAT